jgi:WD40 repeat protein
MHMLSKQDLLIILVVLGLLSSCSTSIAEPTTIHNQIPNTPTSTAALPTQTPIPTRTPTDLPTETPIPTPTQAQPTSTPVDFLPDDLLEISTDNITRLQLLATLPVREIYALVFSHDGSMLATLSESWDDRFNDYLEVWDLESGSQVLALKKLDSPHALFFSSDDSRLSVFYANNGLDTYDLSQGKLAQSTPLDVDQMEISPDGSMMASGDSLGIGDESELKIIDLSTAGEILNFHLPGMIMHLSFSPDGRLFCTGSQLNNHYHNSVWALPDQGLVADLVDYVPYVFSPDGRFAAAVKDKQVTLFSTAGMAYVASYGFSDPYANPVPMGFSLNGDMLAIEDRYNIRFIIPDTGKELNNLADECEVKFSPDGKFLVTWCYQGDLKIWGVAP